MYTTSFEYHRANSVREAVDLLAQYGDDGKILAGGHSLLPMMKLRFVQPKHLIDVRRVPELTGIRNESGAIVIGAATTHAAVSRSPLVREQLPALAEAAGLIGDPLVRNMGTMGGSLAHADPGGDLPAVALALDAQLIAVGPRGERTIAADDFFTDTFTTSLSSQEVLARVRFPIPSGSAGSAYEKLPDPASGYATVGVAGLIIVGGDGAITRARVAITGLTPIAARLHPVEDALVGQKPTESAIESASQKAGDGLDLVSDRNASAAYKANLARVYARRALTRAVARARN